MTLALYGKSKRRQSSLLLAALFAVLIATLGGASLYKSDSAQAATATIAASSASCANDSDTTDSANCPADSLGRVTADDGSEVWLEDDEAGSSSSTGDDDLTVTFSLAAYSGTLNSAKVKIWSTQFGDPAQLKAGSNSDDDKYGQLNAGNPVEYTVTAGDAALGSNFSVYLSAQCTGSPNENCGIKVDKVELLIDYTAPVPGPVSGDNITPVFVAGASNTGKTCDELAPGTTEYKLENAALTNGAHASGPLTVTLASLTTDTFNWSSNIGVDAVIVKGGSNGTNLYVYPSEDTADTGLGVPDAANNGISHISFCYDVDPTPRTIHVGKVVYPIGSVHPGGTFGGNINPGGTDTSWSVNLAANTDYSATQARTVNSLAQTFSENSPPTGWSLISIWYKQGNHTCQAPWSNGFTQNATVPANSNEYTVCVKNDPPTMRKLKVCKTVDANSYSDGQFTLTVTGQSNYQPTVSTGNTACTTYDVVEGSQATVNETGTPAGWVGATGYPKYTLAKGASPAGSASDLPVGGVTVTVNNNNCGTAPDGTASADMDCTVTIINKSVAPSVLTPGITKEKNADGTGNWTIGINNAGSPVAQDIYIEDAGATFVSVVSGGTCSDQSFADGDGLQCSVNASATLLIKVSKTVPAASCAAQTLNNSASAWVGTSTSGTSIGSAGGGAATEYTISADLSLCSGTLTIAKSDAVKDGSLLKWTITVTNTYPVAKTALVYDPSTSLVSETCTNTVSESPGDYYSCDVAASSSAQLVLSTTYPGHSNVCQPLDVNNTAYIAVSNTAGSSGNVGSDGGTYHEDAAPDKSCLTVSKDNSQTSDPPTWNISITNSADVAVTVFVKDAGATYVSDDAGGSCTGTDMTAGIACSVNANSTLVISVTKSTPDATCEGTDVSNTVQVWFGDSDEGEPDFTDTATFEALNGDRSLCTEEILITKYFQDLPDGYTPDSGDLPAFTLDPSEGTSCEAAVLVDDVATVVCTVPAGWSSGGGTVEEDPADGWVEVSDGRCSEFDFQRSGLLRLVSNVLSTVTDQQKFAAEFTFCNRPAIGHIEVIKNIVSTVVPENGLFNLLIGGVVKKTDAGAEGTTGSVELPIGLYSITETAGTGTSLANYSSSVSCAEREGGAPVATPVQLEDGDDVVCIITNTRNIVLASPKLTVNKVITLDASKTTPANDTPGVGWIMTATCSVTPAQSFATNASGVAVGFLGFANGETCTITETLIAGHTLIGWNAVDTGTGATAGTANRVVMTMNDGDDNVVNFYNQPKGSIEVTKTTVSRHNGGNDVPVPQDRDGWKITISSANCGVGPIVGYTDTNGKVTFTNLPICSDYVVTEDVGNSGTIGYGVVGSATVTGRTPANPASQVGFTNRKDTADPPCTTCVTLVTPTPTSVPPTATPVPPTATPKPTEKPKEDKPVDTALGEKTPGAVATPIAPSTGTGFAGTAGTINGLFALVGLIVLGSGLALVAVGRKQRG